MKNEFLEALGSNNANNNTDLPPVHREPAARHPYRAGAAAACRYRRGAQTKSADLLNTHNAGAVFRAPVFFYGQSLLESLRETLKML